MNHHIEELKKMSGEKKRAKEKEEALKKQASRETGIPSAGVTDKDRALWEEVRGELKDAVNEHSFRVFIEPLELIEADKEVVVFESPADTANWVSEHYGSQIAELYAEKTGEEVTVEIRAAS